MRRSQHSAGIAWKSPAKTRRRPQTLCGDSRRRKAADATAITRSIRTSRRTPRRPSRALPGSSRRIDAMVRIDKWLWHARFYRTRVLAQAAASRGVIRLNGHRVEKSSVDVEPGDVLTLPRGSEVVVVRVVGLALRRGPASDAQRLYEVVTETPP